MNHFFNLSVDKYEGRYEMAIYDSCFWCLSLRTGLIMIVLLEIIFQISANVAMKYVDVPLPAVISGNLIASVFTALLIYGIIVQKRSWLWVWLAIDIIIIVLLCILVVSCVRSYLSPGGDVPGQSLTKLASVFLGSISAILVVTRIFFALVVYSYICKLHEQQNSIYNEVIVDNHWNWIRIKHGC